MKPGRVVPRKRGSWARRVRACDEAENRVWYASLGWERHKGRSAAGTVKVLRKDGPGSCVSSGLCNHCAAC